MAVAQPSANEADLLSACQARIRTNGRNGTLAVEQSTCPCQSRGVSRGRADAVEAGASGPDKGPDRDQTAAPRARKSPIRAWIGPMRRDWYRIPDARNSGVRRPNLGRLSTFESLWELSLIHISEPTRRTPISYAVFCLK